MKILLLGARGQIGSALQPALRGLGDVVALGREQADLLDTAALRARILAERPDLLVNAAAYTAVDRAETESELAFRINAQAVGEMAHCMLQLGGTLLHYSTDYVFDGRAARPYTEGDATAPLNRYGASKLAGEEAVRATGVSHLILRTSWIYAQQGQNFLRTILRLAEERPELRIVQDQVGAPTWAREVALASVHALAQVVNQKAVQDWSGTYHLSAAGMTSWYEFAREILRLRHGGALPDRPVLHPIPAADYAAPAKRPAFSVLSNEKFRRRFGLQLPPWQESLSACLKLVDPSN